MKTKTKHVIAEDEGEYSTRQIYVAGGRFFDVVMNGGSRGAHQPKDQVNGSWTFPLRGPTELTRAQALSECAAMGYDEVDLPDDSELASR